MTGVLQSGIQTLLNNGLVELLIFSLIFALVFGILNMISIFGDDEDAKRYNLVIALVFGALAIIPHFVAPGSSYDIVPLVQRAIPQTMLLALGILTLLIVLGLFGMQNFVQEGSSWNWIVALAILGAIVYIFVGATGRVWGLPYFLTPDLVAALLAVLVFAGVVMFVMGKPSEGSSEN
ncbi:MAG: hypothetical protein ACMXYK_03750 [Candidatus Woesearchaeota archaeon]